MTDKERAVYDDLANGARKSLADISVSSGVPLAETHRALERLEEQELVEFVKVPSGNAILLFWKQKERT